MAYVLGTETFMAYTDTPIHRIVSVIPSSTTTPKQVELCTGTSVDYMGVSVTTAKAGELVSIKPFNEAGTYEVQASASIVSGNKVYISTSGRIDDVFSDAYIGRALNSASAGEIVQVVREEGYNDVLASDVIVIDSGGFFAGDNAEDVLQEIGQKDVDQDAEIAAIQLDIQDLQAFDSNLTGSQVALEDTGNFYTTDNVEAALAQVGDTLYTAHVTDEFTTLYHARRTSGGWPINSANLGGVLYGPPPVDPAHPEIQLNQFFLVANDRGAYYGSPMMQMRADSVINANDQFAVTFRPRYRLAYTEVDTCVVKLYYTNFNLSTFMTFNARVSCIGPAGELYATPYSTGNALNAQETYGYIEVADFPATGLTFSPSEITVFLRFDVVTQLTNNVNLYGIGFEYPAHIH